MSCRIMGKNVEYGILSTVEKELRELHFNKLQGRYIPTAKNKPVEKLYERAGYKAVGKSEDADLYELDMHTNPEREFYLEMI